MIKRFTMRNLIFSNVSIYFTQLQKQYKIIQNVKISLTKY